MPKLARLLPALALALIAGRGPAAAGEAATPLPPPAVDMPAPAGGGAQTAVLAGGCFWGIQAVFQHVKGVTRAVSGYAGGTVPSPSYEQVSSGLTGHAESVQITFDPAVISYNRILQIFFSVAHDPTQLDRQGPDVGTQYRSDIFYADADQKRVAEAYIAQLDAAGVFDRPIVTRVDPLTAFYPAEEYHQDFAVKHPDYAYIVFNDAPKVVRLHQLFPEIYREDPVLVTAAE
ncbi:MAG: peptide-methionine (S)-S-oxide reductase MsrA [Rhodospirillaceae bacterium]|nr:peptide-methionine (S)-S-oxide reductase MsrA [Rhodospirillaceae bacterium]